MLTKAVAGGGETWLIGSRDGAQVLLRRDGPGWREVPAPPGAVYGLHILAHDDVWAAGETASGAAVSHWNGQAWQQTIVSGFPRSAVGSVLAVSPTEVWAGGTAGFVGGPVGRPIPPLLVPGPDFLAWNGQSFTEYSEPVVAGEGDSRTLRLAPVPGTATVWSAGRATGPENTFAPRILRFG